jgi:hypothetical protein
LCGMILLKDICYLMTKFTGESSAYAFMDSQPILPL